MTTRFLEIFSRIWQYGLTTHDRHNEWSVRGFLVDGKVFTVVKWTLIGSLKCQHRTIGVKIPLQNIPSTNNCINSQNSSWYHTTNSWKQLSWELLRRSWMIMPRGKFRRGQGRENVHGRVGRPYLSFGWFRRPSQIPIMIQSKLFPIWNNAKWDSSCKTTRSRSNRNWYKILHFYKFFEVSLNFFFFLKFYFRKFEFFVF